MKDWLTIGQLAKRVGTSTRAIRLYEEKGLISSVERGDNLYRYFRESQVERIYKIVEFKHLGFTLAEIHILLRSDMNIEDVAEALTRRLESIEHERRRLHKQKSQIHSILTSLKSKKPTLSQKERGIVMDLFKRARIVVTGAEGLEDIAVHIQSHLKSVGQTAAIIHWKEFEPSKRITGSHVLIIPEIQLTDLESIDLKPDVVVVKAVSEHSEQNIKSYLHLYKSVGPHVATVLNADDRASIEIAKNERVQKGKIYYFSKNKGLKGQIEKIGGVVSDGEEIEIYGFNRKPGPLSIQVEKVLSLSQEVALLAALGAVMDLGIERERFPATV